MDLEAKHRKLKELLKGYKKVAIAFSGGVDSSLLLFVCCDVLGVENVIGFQAVSCLLSPDVIDDAKIIFTECTGDHSRLHYIEIDPMEWDEFVKNSEERCYICKKNVYSSLTVFMKKLDCDFLLDGTNVDDLHEHRPGFKAIQELGVKTPLLAAGLNKLDVRELAKRLGLSNHDLPSNSCLATRLAANKTITRECLEDVIKAESILNNMGFCGFRVRPLGSQVIIEIQKNDYSRLVQHQNRQQILREFKILGFQQILLDLNGKRG